ncbi:MAG: methyltransferase domain-containing protein [Deltaproteobacteria bacterium]
MGTKDKVKQTTNTCEQQTIINYRDACSVCDAKDLSEILDLPNLPITGLFSKDKPVNFLSGFNQSLLWCPKCGHGQLRNQINPSILYDSSKYSFKTSISATARIGTENFITFLKRVSLKKKYNCILDVGCNDLYLLEKLEYLGKYKVGIDPIWRTKVTDNVFESTNVIGETIEEANLKNLLPSKPDLILCRHTLEHIYNPLQILRKLIECSADDALFVFELPSFESMIERLRFDQIFHEHLQYFSKSSFEEMLINSGANVIEFDENYHDWGALLIAFKKDSGQRKNNIFSFSERNICQRLDIFRKQLESTYEIIRTLKPDSLYGYGAALMLPVLAYHFKSDLSFLAGIIDDDKNKDGIYYQNLPMQIIHSSKIKELEKLSILITALDNIKPIMSKLLSVRPKHIIYPFNLI